MVPLKSLMAQRPGATLAVAESLTCGVVQARIGEVSGASNFFVGGITTYTLDQKVRHLGVDRDSAAACNCVSEGVVRQMALGATRLFDATFALATTGYAEPAPAEGGTVPFAWWAVAERRTPEGWHLISGRVNCPDRDRQQVRARVADIVLGALMVHLQTPTLEAEGVS